MSRVSIKKVLQEPQMHSGWLYLPEQPWTLETQGVFALDDKDVDLDENLVPAIAQESNWQEVLDSDTIEDVVENAKAQVLNPTISQVFEAFIYYVENDAFIDFGIR